MHGFPISLQTFRFPSTLYRYSFPKTIYLTVFALHNNPHTQIHSHTIRECHRCAPTNTFFAISMDVVAHSALAAVAETIIIRPVAQHTDVLTTTVVGRAGVVHCQDKHIHYRYSTCYEGYELTFFITSQFDLQVFLSTNQTAFSPAFGLLARVNLEPCVLLNTKNLHSSN